MAMKKQAVDAAIDAMIDAGLQLSSKQLKDQIKTIYDAPLAYHNAGMDRAVLEAFGILEDSPEPELSVWEDVSDRMHKPDGEVKVAVVGKYTQLEDAYKSISEALTHGGMFNRVKVKLEWIDAEIFEKADNVTSTLSGFHAVLVPGGFGERGTEGKIKAAKYARENKIPYLGICLGMQMAVIEYSRNILNLEDSNSTEMDEKTSHPVISLMQDQKNIINKGGTMRLGSWGCDLDKGSKVFKIYNSKIITERHRHRWELNNDYLIALQDSGLKTSGINSKTGLVEIIELPTNDWFIGVQFHPEKSQKSGLKVLENFLR